MARTQPSELDFLQSIYDHFKVSASWPDVRTLQVRIGDGQSVRRLAAQIGADKVLCEEQQEGICFLKLEGMAACKESDRDIDNFLGVIRYIGSRYAEVGKCKITSDEIQSRLQMDDLEMKRLGDILWREHGIWSQAGRSPSNPADFWFEPGENAFFFQRVSSLEELKATHERVDRDSREAAMMLFRHQASSVPVLDEALTKARFATNDKELDDLLEKARTKFRGIDPKVRKEALEHLWGAFERVKTVEAGKDKKESATRLLDRASIEPNFRQLLEDEAKALTRIGNNFMIRHKETNKTPINENEHVDYLFHRLFAFLRLVLRQSGRGG